MHFCTVCQNMYYIRLTGENKDQLIYYCRKCGNEDDELISSLENVCVSQTQLKASVSSYEHIINKYTKLDPTLPHINNIKCPNTACASNESADETKDGDDQKEADILYLRYDDTNMKFVYLCTECNTVWKSADDK
jgi:DNA-directed RNA polymerase subunit M/transcription elongation factor TFIIS